MKNAQILRRLLLLLLLVMACNAPAVLAQDLLEETGGYAKHYLLELSGTIGKEKVVGTKAILFIAGPPPGSPNPYLVIVEGFPRVNVRNCFFWNSEYSSMEVLSDEITCDIKRSFGKQPDINFFHLSPALLKKLHFYTQQEKEDRQRAEKMVLPTRIYAQAGRLRIRVSSNTVSGSVWLKGYDAVQHSYVPYSVTFKGRSAMYLELGRYVHK